MPSRPILLAVLSTLILGSSAVQADLVKPVQPVLKTRENPAQTPQTINRPLTVTTPMAPAAMGVRPLMSTLLVSQAITPTSICAALKPKSNALTDSYGKYRTALNSVGESCSLTGKSVSLKLDSVLYEQCCDGNVSFSVHDQQMAGCVGSDTVSACMEKLTRQCIRSRAQSENLTEELRKQSEAFKELSTRSAEVANQMRAIQMIMP